MAWANKKWAFAGAAGAMSLIYFFLSFDMIQRLVQWPYLYFLLPMTVIVTPILIYLDMRLQRERRTVFRYLYIYAAFFAFALFYGIFLWLFTRHASIGAVVVGFMGIHLYGLPLLLAVWTFEFLRERAAKFTGQR